MKRWLRKGFCLALGLTCMRASAQELNFRAVAPPPAASAIPITLSRPAAADASFIPVFRAKGQEDASGILLADTAHADGIRFVQKDTPRLTPVPQGMPTDFFPPQPQLIAPPLIDGPIGAHPSTIMSGPMVSGPMVSGPVSGPVSTSGCVCSDSGFSVLDGFISDDPLGCACGNTCSTCDSCWYPFQHVHDFFSCLCNNGCCGPRPAHWIRAEYLMWGVTQQNVPALATQFAGGPGNFLNLPLGAGSTVIYDSNNINNSTQNGVRIGMGFWFPRHNDWGMDFSYFYLGNRTGHFSANSDGTTAIGRPFINDNPASPVFGQNDAQIVATQNPDGTLVPGGLAITTNTQLWGVDANLRRKLCCGPNYWIDGLVGYRHLQLQDSVNISENIGLRDNLAGVSAGHTFVNDYFGTHNTFNGGQVGLEAEWRFRPRLTLGGTFKVAAGNLQQNILIDGSTTIDNGNFNGNQFARQTQPGGFLTQATNMGSFSRDRFVVVPELGLRFGWDITQHWRFYAGYNILYIPNVVRAGEQIDLRVNTSQNAFAGVDANGRAIGTRGVLTPGTPATPAVLFRQSDFWAQGVSLGLEYRY